MTFAKYVLLLTSVALSVVYASADENTLFRVNADKYEVSEDIGTFYVYITRDGADIKTPVEIKYETKSGTATSGLDYVGISGTVLFLPGDRHKAITVQINDDKLVEPTESFTLALTEIKGGKLGEEKESTITILDNDK